MRLVPIAIIIVLILVVSIGSYNQLTANSISKPQGEIVIGAIQPLTGNSASVAKEVKDGMDLAVEDINSQGGINGKTLRVLYEDDQCDAKQAVNAFEKLTSIDNVKVVIGPTCSSNVLAVAPIANEKKVIILTTVASTPKVTEAGDYIFRNTPTGKDYSQLMAEFAYQKLGARKASTIYLNLDNGIDFNIEFVKKFKELSGNVLGEYAYEKTEKDFRSILSKVKNENPDVIFLAGQINHGLAVKQVREMGIDTQIIGPTTIQTPDFITTAGGAAEGVIYSAPKFDKTDPIVKEFENKYKQKYGNSTLGYRVVIAYDAVMIIASVLKQCGEDVECIKQGLYNTQNYQGISGTTSFDENGDVVKPLAIMMVNDGEFVEYKN